MASFIDLRQELPVLAYIGLGANLGEKVRTLSKAIEVIAALPDTERVVASSFYKTAPVDAAGDDYVNAVLAIKTKLSARELLHELQKIEAQFGRVRPVGIVNAPRTMDLDLLLYGNVESDDPELLLPHPRMRLRAFVLVPLKEILSGDFLLEGKTLNEWIGQIKNQRIERLLEKKEFCEASQLAKSGKGK